MTDNQTGLPWMHWQVCKEKLFMNILLCLQKQRSPNECKYLSVFLVVYLLSSSQSITFLDCLDQKNCAFFIFLPFIYWTHINDALKPDLMSVDTEHTVCFIFALSVTLKYLKKCQGIRGGLWVILCRWQWVKLKFFNKKNFPLDG